jgi:hypothetical protein
MGPHSHYRGGKVVCGAFRVQPDGCPGFGKSIAMQAQRNRYINTKHSGERKIPEGEVLLR